MGTGIGSVWKSWRMLSVIAPTEDGSEDLTPWSCGELWVLPLDRPFLDGSVSEHLSPGWVATGQQSCDINTCSPSTNMEGRLPASLRCFTLGALVHLAHKLEGRPHAPRACPGHAVV